MASTLENKEKVEEEEESSENAAAGEEEDTGAHIAPIVRLQEVAVSTGEEDEDCLLDLKAKLYRFDRGQWKERGVGSVRLLRHRQTGKVRLVMRQSKTLKICANHLVLPTMTTQEHAGNEKSCVWHAADFADGELKEETFAIRFASAENCKAFREKIEEIAESQGKKDTAEGSAAAELIEKALMMSSDANQPKLQIYSPSNGQISAFWRDKYEKDANKYWDIFYKRHQDKFFKDRHYLDKEWGIYFSGEGRKQILEVGCGAGNTIFPLLSTYPDIFAHACDFSPRAVNLVKMHKEFSAARVNAFVCDPTADDLTQHISPSSVDVVTMIFVLSAVSPEKMPMVLQNIKKILKPDGHVLFRDYATGDLAQERLTLKEQKISENFYVRGDGTRAFYFSDEFLASLFKENGFGIEEHVVCCKTVKNKSRELVMNRRWVQAVFSAAHNSSSFSEDISKPKLKDITPLDIADGSEIDIPDEMVADMFGITYSSEEIIEVGLRDFYNFKIKVISKEYQHTCNSTGLMLWESARLMAAVLATNPTIVAEKRVLELGCGCAGICSMIAASTAEIIVATDGDKRALDLLNQNLDSNLREPHLGKLITKRLEWGNTDDIEAIKRINSQGFDVIIGTDITYVAEAINPLFATANELIASSSSTKEKSKPALIFCHVFRRVDEPSLLLAAAQFGFKLIDRWPEQAGSGPSQRIIDSWFSGDVCDIPIPTAALNIMYFQRE